MIHGCALRTFHVTDSQSTRDQITSDRRFKCAWSNCVLCIPSILSGSPNECWLHTRDACVITTWRLGLRAPLVARNDKLWWHCFRNYFHVILGKRKEHNNINMCCYRLWIPSFNDKHRKRKSWRKQTWRENLQALIYFAPATVCPKKKIRKPARHDVTSA